MFLSRNKKNNAYPCKPQFYYIKVGFKGVKIIQVCFRDVLFLVVTSEKETCAPSEDSGHPAHSRSLISIFLVCI